MIRLDTDLAFIDCETLGLDPLAPVWEFAGVRLDRDGREMARETFLIQHNPGDWPDQLPEQFRADYQDRYRPESAWATNHAAKRIKAVTDGAVIAGSNPSFDMLRLEKLLRANGVAPGWHYHPLDIPSMALGWIARRAHHYESLHSSSSDVGWKSDRLSNLICISPTSYARHTAAGDVNWCLAQWRAMTGQEETR